MISGPECLQLYLSIKLHFTSERYDAVKYNWKVNKKIDWEKRNDKFYFQKLAKHSQPKNLLIANLSVNSNAWIGDILSPSGEALYRKMMGRWESITYTFSEDLKKLDDDFQTNVVINNHQHPVLLKLFLQKKVCLETIVVLDSLLKFHALWDKELTDPVWKSLSLIIKRYGIFLKYDKRKMKQLFLKRFSEIN